MYRKIFLFCAISVVAIGVEGNIQKVVLNDIDRNDKDSLHIEDPAKAIDSTRIKRNVVQGPTSFIQTSKFISNIPIRIRTTTTKPNFQAAVEATNDFHPTNGQDHEAQVSNEDNSVRGSSVFVPNPYEAIPASKLVSQPAHFGLNPVLPQTQLQTANTPNGNVFGITSGILSKAPIQSQAEQTPKNKFLLTNISKRPISRTPVPNIRRFVPNAAPAPIPAKVPNASPVPQHRFFPANAKAFEAARVEVNPTITPVVQNKFQVVNPVSDRRPKSNTANTLAQQNTLERIQIPVEERPQYRRPAIRQPSQETLRDLQNPTQGHLYSFESKIDDLDSKLKTERSEVREGNTVRGMYSYSDGYFMRTVHYEADEKGFRIVREEVKQLDSNSARQ